MSNKKYKKIIGGTKADAEKKFPWLREADFSDAVIDITHAFLIWRYGTWQYGTWQYGTWQYGTWKDGTWKDGTWKDGTWEGGTWQYGTWQYGTWEDGIWGGGMMWSNTKQCYVDVMQKDGEFAERPSRAGA